MGSRLPRVLCMRLHPAPITRGQVHVGCHVVRSSRLGAELAGNQFTGGGEREEQKPRWVPQWLRERLPMRDYLGSGEGAAPADAASAEELTLDSAIALSYWSRSL